MPSSLNIMAIGGGGPDTSAAPLLTRGVELAGKEHGTNVLVVPTAKVTQEAHDTTVAASGRLFSERLGLPHQVLHEFGAMPTKEEVAEKIEWADVVYISGGDTARMMEIWKANGVESLLKTRSLGGLVITGISAGAIAPFTWGHSDSMSYRVEDGETWDYIPVDGLSLANAGITPHYNTCPEDKPRSERFSEMFQRESLLRQTKYGFGIDNYAAIEISEGIITPRTANNESGVTVLERTESGTATHRLTSADYFLAHELLSSK